MNFKQYLLNQGLSSQQVNGIVKGMVSNSFYLVKEEHLELRYHKLKQQKKKLAGDFIEIQKQNEFLKESLSKQLDLAAKVHQKNCLITDLKTELAQVYKKQSMQQSILLTMEEQLKLADKLFTAPLDKFGR